jgi:GntR family transcriptional regulator, transcriptional repressor for pyruvate dehydrogenase complex
MTPTPKQKIRRKRLSEELTAQLRKYIIDNDLKPGDQLLTEQQMVERFGVSHTVVREATKALDFLGIIDAAPRRGMVLDRFDFNRVSEYLGFHFALSDYPKEQLLKSRAVIETGSLFFTMEAMQKNPALYEKLKQLAEGAPENADAGDPRWIQYEIAFHRGLVEASELAPLASFCDLLQAFFHKYRPIMSGHQGDHQTHIRIVEELRAGHLETATQLLRSQYDFYFNERHK